MNLEKIINNHLEMIKTSKDMKEASIYISVFSKAIASLNKQGYDTDKLMEYIVNYSEIIRNKNGYKGKI